MIKILDKFKKNTSEQVKASAAYTICSILQKCLSLITLPFFSRMLTTDEYGLSTVYVSTMSLLIIFTSLQLPYGSFSTAMTKFENDRNSYITSVNFVCTCLTVLYFIIYLSFRSFWNSYLNIPTVLMILMGFEMLMSTSLNFWMGRQRFEIKYKSVIAVTLFISVLGTAVCMAAVYFSDNRGVVKVVVSSVFGIVVGLVPYLTSMLKARSEIKMKYIKYALGFNLPLIPYYLSQMIFNQSDRLMIDKMCSRSDAAMYGVAYSLALVLTFVLNAINNSYVPWFYGKLKEKEYEANKKVSFAITVLMAVLLLFVIAAAPEIIYILAGSKYTSAVGVVPPVAMSLIFLLFTQFSINVEFFYEEKKYIVGGSILSAVVNVVLNYFCLKSFSFVAAAYTTLISFILFALCNYWNMLKICRKYDINENLYDTSKLIILALIFCTVGFGFMLLYKLILIRYIIIAVLLIIFLINYKKILNAVKYYASIFK